MEIKDIKSSIESVKDIPGKFYQKFLTLGGRELYTSEQYTTLPRGKKLCDTKRGTYKPEVVKKLLGKGLSITMPVNGFDYSSKDYVFQRGKSDVLYAELDFTGIIHGGYIEVYPCKDEEAVILLLGNILPKYRKENSSWNYRFITDRTGLPWVIITCPTKNEEWEDILKAFTELCVLCRILLGSWYKLYLFETKDPDITAREKYFSVGDLGTTLASFIPTILGVGYRLLHPVFLSGIRKKLHGKINPGERELRTRILQYITKAYGKDVYFVNLGDGSCFINPKYISKEGIEKLRPYGDANRGRTMIDWLLKGYDDGKCVVFYNDADSSFAIAHEVGHYEIDKEGGYQRALQNAKTKWLCNENFIRWFGYLSGYLTGMLTTGIPAMISELTAQLVSLLQNSPTLFSEYQASYRGYQLLKDKVGCTDEELKTCADYFRAAWCSYMAHAGKDMSRASIGRLLGMGAKAYMESRYYSVLSKADREIQ